MKTLKFLEIFLGVLLFLCIIPAVQVSIAEETLVKTPADYEGPFYPVTMHEDNDNDLLQVKGQAGIAKGEILNLSGTVVNTNGEPQQGLTVEIWQTDPQGRYKHPGDSTPGERDPYFQYWGATVTAGDGSFFFKTLVPGAYYPRPAHIHYKVWRDGKLLLTSQIYFKKQAEGARPPSLTGQVELQTVGLKPVKNGEFEAFFRIVI
jgi:protocatechuate 3,4-dioxygenase beta subunit